MDREVWIGLVEVVHRPGAGAFLDRNKAYVNVLALAANAEEYVEKTRGALWEAGFDTIELEDVEPLAYRSERYIVQEDLLTLAKEVEATETVRFGTFHTWTTED